MCGATRVADDLAEVAALLGSRLRDVGLAVGAERCGRFVRGVLVVRPGTLAGVLECARATLTSSWEEGATLEAVFAELFAGAEGAVGQRGPDERDGVGISTLARVARVAREHPGGQVIRVREAWESGAGWDASDLWGGGSAHQAAEVVGGAGQPAVGRSVASAVERLGGTDFSELTASELLELAGAMRGIALAVPSRRSRRSRRGRRGRGVDLRATLRLAGRAGHAPYGIVRKKPRLRARKLVVLCDISGSMEPYARAMLQLLYCAAGGARAEVFSFATRLTRLTRVLAQPQPHLALRSAGQAAPDWLGGTRIGACLKEFNDAYGSRGVARGAVVVVVSDGWDTGEPAVVRREMARLSRMAYRIVWVNPRAQSPRYRPLAGGMAAAWPYCDAVVSAHRLDALDELTAALADPVRRRVRSAPAERGGVRWLG
jgi:uncharacterized protein